MNRLDEIERRLRIYECAPGGEPELRLFPMTERDARAFIAVARAAVEALDQVRGPAETKLHAALAPLLEQTSADAGAAHD